MAAPDNKDLAGWDLEGVLAQVEGSKAAAAAAGDAGEEGRGLGADRVLNQDEIDSLLGFDPHAGGAAELSGVEALINSALVSYERLPMLEIVFDRLVRLATTSLRNFTSDNVEVSMDSISSVRFGTISTRSRCRPSSPSSRRRSGTIMVF